MALFALSLLASRHHGAGVQNYHAALVVEAVSMDEAIGKGYPLIRKVRPSSEGWGNYSVGASVLEPVTLETLDLAKFASR